MSFHYWLLLHYVHDLSLNAFLTYWCRYKCCCHSPPTHYAATAGICLINKKHINNNSLKIEDFEGYLISTRVRQQNDFFFYFFKLLFTFLKTSSSHPKNMVCRTPQNWPLLRRLLFCLASIAFHQAIFHVCEQKEIAWDQL